MARPKHPDPICGVENCGRPSKTKGFCGKHYKRLWRHRDPEARLIREYSASDVCETPDCTNRPVADGLCKGCSIRFYRKGHTGRDIAKKGEGRPRTKAGYILLTINGKRVYEHRHVMEQRLGRKLRPGEVVHHENVPRDYNSPDTLELFENQSDHMKHHWRNK